MDLVPKDYSYAHQSQQTPFTETFCVIMKYTSFKLIKGKTKLTLTVLVHLSTAPTITSSSFIEVNTALGVTVFWLNMLFPPRCFSNVQPPSLSTPDIFTGSSVN